MKLIDGIKLEGIANKLNTELKKKKSGWMTGMSQNQQDEI